MRVEGQTFLSLLLSHHPVDKLHLCYAFRIGARWIHVCARCLGLYPAMAVTMVAGALYGAWPWWLEWILLFLPPLPAFLDWGTTTASGRPASAGAGGCHVAASITQTTMKATVVPILDVRLRAISTSLLDCFLDLPVPAPH